MYSNTISVYIASKSSLAGKVQQIDNLIAAFELRLIEVIEGQNSVVNEYRMDDGQMSVRTVYRSVVELENGIASLEKLRQRYLNRLNGRSFVLRDASKLGYY